MSNVCATPAIRLATTSDRPASYDSPSKSTAFAHGLTGFTVLAICSAGGRRLGHNRTVLDLSSGDDHRIHDPDGTGWLDLEIELENRPGTLATLGRSLGEAGVSLEGGGVFATGDEAVAHFLVAQLDQLGRLHSAGVLDDAEFAAAKAKLLG